MKGCGALQKRWRREEIRDAARMKRGLEGLYGALVRWCCAYLVILSINKNPDKINSANVARIWIWESFGEDKIGSFLGGTNPVRWWVSKSGVQNRAENCVSLQLGRFKIGPKTARQ